MESDAGFNLLSQALATGALNQCGVYDCFQQLHSQGCDTEELFIVVEDLRSLEPSSSQWDRNPSFQATSSPELHGSHGDTMSQPLTAPIQQLDASECSDLKQVGCSADRLGGQNRFW